MKIKIDNIISINIDGSNGNGIIAATATTLIIFTASFVIYLIQ